MGKGYCGRILHVDLSRKEFSVEEPEEAFYRKYLGGSCLASYYLNQQLPGGIDPLGPENILIFATSPTTGAPISGSSRFNITAKSPLTGAIGDSQGGGYWGPELKLAGFDALVIKGKASRPVYLYIKDGEYSLRDATSIWGQKLKEAEQQIKQELGDEKTRVALIGPGGENLVRYACIANELSHFNGRTGMGAVMGSKNLKAVAVRGTQSCQFAAEDKIKDMARMGAKSIKDNPLVSSLQEYGTAGGIDVSQGIGGLPTHNYSSGVFAQAEEINGEKMLEELLEKRGTCRSCAVRCKRILKPGGPYDLDPDYGGPEFETLCSLGSNLEIGDLAAVCKANELCNSYGLDTISLGGTVAFALECYEQGLIDSDDTGGLELKFGDVDILFKLIEMIARREGIGDLLAEGSARAAKKIGNGAEELAIHVKKQELPMHMPRVKPVMALAYACGPFGADHQSSAHDDAIAFSPLDENIKGLGFREQKELNEFSFEKVKLWTYSQQAYSLLDTLDLCQFCFGYYPPLYDMKYVVELLNAATGWETTFWELMLVGERRVNLMRAFNYREGFDSSDDKLPSRLSNPLPEGPAAGQKIDPEQFKQARKDYYRLAGWEVETGKPTAAKLKELGLEWVIK